MEEEKQTARLLVVSAIAGTAVIALVLAWVVWFGPLFNQASFNNFNNSQQHIYAVEQKFSDDCQQLAETHDPVARKAIENDIYSVAATVPMSRIQIPDQTQMCVQQAINDVTNNP